MHIHGIPTVHPLVGQVPLGSLHVGDWYYWLQQRKENLPCKGEVSG